MRLDAVLYKDNEIISDVCKKCVKSGSQNLPSIIKSHARKIRAWVRHLEELACEDIALPTAEDYESATKELVEIDRQYRELVENGQKKMKNENKS